MEPFWTRKELSDMTAEEWESLCDGCGRCCLLKLEDEDEQTVHYTDVACRLLDCDSCRCSDYANRLKEVPDCLKLDPVSLVERTWLPSTCAYKLLLHGKELHWWHPLVSGSTETVHQAGISVRHRVLRESDIKPKYLKNRIVTWPE